jgi:hypothetical protein
VEHHVVAFREHLLDVRALAGIVRGHLGEVVDEGLLAIGHRRVVLGVLVTGVPFDRVPRPALVEHQVVEGGDRLLVSPQVAHFSG